MNLSTHYTDIKFSFFQQEREQKKIKSKNKSKQRREAQKAERARQAAAQLLVNQANALVSTVLSRAYADASLTGHVTSCQLVIRT